MITAISTVLFIIRVILPFLATLVVMLCFRSMRTTQRGKRSLIILRDKLTGEEKPIIYWENSIGRSRSCDIVI